MMTKTNEEVGTNRLRALQMLLAESLVPGQEHKGLPMNVRSTARELGMEELKQSIEQDGLLQALLVWRDTEGDGRDYVVDGSRRLDAINALRAKSDELANRFEVIPCLLREGGTAADAMAKSLAANIMQVPLNLVDRYETFAALFDSMLPSMDPTSAITAIAARYGSTPDRVKRALALGELAPEIRTAIKAEHIDIETAKAFTLLKDKKRQAELFKKLAGKKGDGQVSVFQVRRAIIGDDRETGKWLNFVGRDTYTAQDGEIITDLFAEDGKGDGVSDRVLLGKLAEEKTKGLVDDLVAEGWKWAALDTALPYEWHYSWERKKLKKKDKPSDVVKAGAGVVITIADDGSVSYEYGVVKPGDKKAKASAGTKAGKADKKIDKTPELSNAMERELARMATKGMAAAIAKAPADVVLSLLLAGFAATDMNGPVRVEAHGMPNDAGETPQYGDDGETYTEFAGALKILRKKGKANLTAGVTAVTAGALDLRMSGNPLPLQDENAAAIAATLAPAVLNKALREAFDASAYFEGVNRIFVERAIQEAMGKSADHTALARMSKGDLAEYATANVPKTGWLPPELRTYSYDGPGDKPKAAAKAKPKAKGKKARR